MNKYALEKLYKEVFDARKQQQEDLILINNKFNWLIVSNILLLIYLADLEKYTFFFHLAIITSLTSLLLSLWSLSMKPYKRGPSFKKMREAVGKVASEKGESIFLRALSKKIIEGNKKNKKTIKKFAENLKISIILLSVSIISIVLDSVL